MKLNDIIDEIFGIANAIEHKTISYFNPLLVSVQNKAKPEDLLLAIAAPLKRKITNGIPLGKAEIIEALKALKKVAKDYKIAELRKLTKELEAYLDSIG